MNSLSSIILESAYLWPVALGVCAAATIAVGWLYPPQVRGEGGWGWVTLSLRWIALVVLAIALLKPVLLQTGGDSTGGGVEILLDCSKSMAVVDTGRTVPQLVALAGALGRLPEGVRSDAGSGMLQQVQQLESLAQGVVNALGDLEYARVVGRGIADRQSALRQTVDRYSEAVRGVSALADTAPVGSELRSQLLDLNNVPALDQRRAWNDRVNALKKLRTFVVGVQAASDEALYQADPQVRATCESLAKLTRLQLAEAALASPNGLVAKLGANGAVRAYAIDQELRPITLDPHTGSPVNPSRLRPEGKGSNLTSAVGAAVAAAAGRSVRAVVVLSDGRQTRGRGDVTSAIRPSGIPVFTVGVAASVVPDVWISGVTMPSAAFQGETLDGQVEVRRQEMADAPEAVTITTPTGAQLVHLQPRNSTDGKPSTTEFTARFSLPIDPPAAAASERIVFSVERGAKEVSDDNNHIERWVKVSSAKLRVAAFSASTTWDFQYLRASLTHRPWVNLNAQILDAAHPRLAMQPQEILTQDVIVLHDIPVEALDVNQWDAVSRLVNDRGGSVIIIPGTAAALANWSRQPIAAGLLPFHDVRPTWKQWPGEQPAFHFSPTPLGESAALRLGDEPQHRWQELPAVFRFLQIPDKNLYSDVHKLLLETDTGSSVLTERQLAAGRAFFVGLDETWRWRLKSGERDADQFWRQLIRHAAGEPYAASRGGIALDVEKVSCQPGESVGVRARVRGIGAGSTALTAKALSLQIRKGRSILRTISLPAEGGGRFAGPLPGLSEGDYDLEVGVTARGRAEVVGVPLHVAGNDELEMRNLSGDPDLLRHISRASGGQYEPLESVDRIPGWVDAVHNTDSQLVRKPLYQSPLLFVFVLACLSGEWALRKRLGLA
ncbi:MAG TPA: hypothetical protein VIM11_15055 [Tepidisphaeraceae bacterium]